MQIYGEHSRRLEILFCLMSDIQEIFTWILLHISYLIWWVVLSGKLTFLLTYHSLDLTLDFLIEALTSQESLENPSASRVEITKIT